MALRTVTAVFVLSFSPAVAATGVADGGSCARPVDRVLPPSAGALIHGFSRTLLSLYGVSACRTYSINVIPAPEHRAGDEAISEDFEITQGLLYQAAETLESISAVGGTCRIHWQVDSFEDLRRRLIAYSRSCRGCVSSLNVDGHGSAGRSVLARGGDALLDIQNVGNLSDDDARTISGLFSAGARIRFLGCNIGEGKRGRTFLSFVGQQMLGARGGRVTAFTGTAKVNRYATRFSELSVSDGPRLEYVQPPAGAGPPSLGTFVERGPVSVFGIPN